jgi:hypothetical protein
MRRVLVQLTGTIRAEDAEDARRLLEERLEGLRIFGAVISVTDEGPVENTELTPNFGGR